MSLTSQQLEEYKRDGFLVLKDFVSAEQCNLLRTRAEELVDQFDPRGVVSIFSTHEQNRIADKYFLESSDKIRFFFEEDAFLPDGQLRYEKARSINKIGHALHDLDPVFSAFSRSADIRSLIESLGVIRPLLVQSMYIFKQPKIGGEVNCHQDSTFLYTKPTDIVGLWFALEDATIENGCLWAIPGAHKLGLKSRWIRSEEEGMKFETIDAAPFDERQLVPLEVSKGTLILLNGLSPHKSLANQSDKSRHAYTLHVISGNADYPKTNWLLRPSDMPLQGF